jgi:putative ABC transport system substrate-binding protein
MAGCRQLSRRRFVWVAGGAAGLALLGPATACIPSVPRIMDRPQATRIPRIGYVHSSTQEAASRGEDATFENLLIGLSQLGYVEGQNLRIEARFADEQADRLPVLVDELLELPVEVLVVGDTRGNPVATQATRTVPIVLMFTADPVGLGYVQSLSHPGGNVTGLVSPNLELAAKRLELLKLTVPSIKTVAVLHNPRRAQGIPEWEAVRDGAARMNLEVVELRTETAEELGRTLREPLPQPVDALYVLPDVLFLRRIPDVVDFATRHNLPGMYGSKAFLEAGGLLTYVPDRPVMFRRAAYYVDRILKGTKPAELPMEQPNRYEFLVNLAAARKLGVEISAEARRSATGVVE